MLSPGKRPHATTLSVTYSSVERAATVAAALRPEVGEIADDRSSAGLERDGETVTVEVGADDLTALRAGCTTWTSLLDVASAVAGEPDGWLELEDGGA